MKKFTVIFFGLLVALMFNVANASSHKEGITKQNEWPTVNILQWWGYISSADPYIKKIEQTCHANISYKQYYSNDELLSKMKHQDKPYDIIIFSDTIFNAIKTDIADKDSSLYKLSKNYYPIIKQHYEANNFPHNVVYFLHSLTGFLYNPKTMSINDNDSLFDIFRQAKGKTVVMLEDPVDAQFLLSLGTQVAKKSKTNVTQKLNLVPLTIKQFKPLYNGTYFVINNLPESIVTKPNFAFAYQWSGDAIKLFQRSKGKLQFFIHPKLSYVTSDLLASLNNKKTTMCIANALGGELCLQHEQNKTFYFSPYVKGSHITDPYFKKVFDGWKKNLSTLSWIISVDEKQFRTLDAQWNRIKLDLKEYNKSDASS